MSDPNFYRKYECNIDCYKLKATKNLRCTECSLGDATADSLSVSKLYMQPGNVLTYSGSSSIKGTHTITSSVLPVLANTSCNGHITFYLNNDLYVGVAMGVILKSKGTILQTIVYQKISNFTFIGMQISGSNVQLITIPNSEIKWVYTGI